LLHRNGRIGVWVRHAELSSGTKSDNLGKQMKVVNDVVYLKNVGVNDGVYRENVGLITCDVTFCLDCDLILSLENMKQDS
jgi:hypothetical protein